MPKSHGKTNSDKEGEMDIKTLKREGKKIMETLSQTRKNGQKDTEKKKENGLRKIIISQTSKKRIKII